MATIVTDFDNIMAHSITIEPYTGVDGFGANQYGTAVTHNARIVGRVQRVLQDNGEERVSNRTVYLSRAAQIDPRSRITLPSGHDPLQPEIIGVRKFADEYGNTHSIVFI